MPYEYTPPEQCRALREATFSPEKKAGKAKRSASLHTTTMAGQRSRCPRNGRGPACDGGRRGSRRQNRLRIYGVGNSRKLTNQALPTPAACPSTIVVWGVNRLPPEHRCNRPPIFEMKFTSSCEAASNRRQQIQQLNISIRFRKIAQGNFADNMLHRDLSKDASQHRCAANDPPYRCYQRDRRRGGPSAHFHRTAPPTSQFLPSMPLAELIVRGRRSTARRGRATPSMAIVVLMAARASHIASFDAEFHPRRATCALLRQRDQHDFRRNAPERHDARRSAAGDDDVAMPSDMAIDELTRCRHRRPAEQPPPWGVAGELQRWLRPRDVGLMCHQNGPAHRR